MPQMGESVTEGTILEWHDSEGQEISEGDTVVEVSTDKIDAEVPAPASGVVTKLLVQPDDVVTVGQVLAEIDPNGTGAPAAEANGDSGEVEEAPAGDAGPGDAEEAPEEQGGSEAGPGLAVAGTGEGDADIGGSDPGQLLEDAQGASSDDDIDVGTDSATAEATGETVVIAMPEMGESVTEGTVLEWHVAEGDSVGEGDTVIEVSTDKIDAEVPAPGPGTITKLLVQPDDVVKVGQPLAEMEAGTGSPASTEQARSDATAPGREAEEAAGPASDGAKAS